MIKTYFCMLVFGIIASISVYSVDVPVPASQEIILNSDVILLVKLKKQNDECFCGLVKEVIKGDKDLLGKFVKIVSPYPEFSFPLNSWGRENLNKSVLILGKWNEHDDSASLIFGTASFWPKGAPADVSRKKDISECIEYAKKHVKNNRK